MANQNDIQLMEGEVIEKGNIKGDYWHGGIGPFVQTQTSGTYTFTNKRVMFKPTGLLTSGKLLFTLDYKEIESLKKSQVAFFIPTGILLSMKDGKKYKLSLLGRKGWIDFIQSHMK